MAQYATGWGEYTVGIAPHDWTRRWSTTGQGWTVEEDPFGSPYGFVLRKGDGSSSSTGERGYTWDKIDSDPDTENVELLVLFRGLVASTSNNQSDCRTVIRGSNESSITCYSHGQRFSSASGQGLRLQRYITGSATLLEHIPSHPPVGEWWWQRIRVNGGDHYSKRWKYGETEPATWTLTATDNQVTGPGWVGLFNFTDRGYDIGFFSVGTNGDSAPNELLSVTKGETRVTLAGAEAVHINEEEGSSRVTLSGTEALTESVTKGNSRVTLTGVEALGESVTTGNNRVTLTGTEVLGESVTTGNNRVTLAGAEVLQAVDPSIFSVIWIEGTVEGTSTLVEWEGQALQATSEAHADATVLQLNLRHVSTALAYSVSSGTTRQVSTAFPYAVSNGDTRNVSTAVVYAVHGPNKRAVSTAVIYAVCPDVEELEGAEAEVQGISEIYGELTSQDYLEEELAGIAIVSGEADVWAPLYGEASVYGIAQIDVDASVVGPVYAEGSIQGIAQTDAEIVESFFWISTYVQGIARVPDADIGGPILIQANVKGIAKTTAELAVPDYMAYRMRGIAQTHGHLSGPILIEEPQVLRGRASTSLTMTGTEYAETHVRGIAVTAGYQPVQFFTNFDEYPHGWELREDDDWDEILVGNLESYWHVLEDDWSSKCEKRLQRTSKVGGTTALDPLFYVPHGQRHRQQIVKTRVRLDNTFGETAGAALRITGAPGSSTGNYYSAILYNGTHFRIYRERNTLVSYEFPHAAGHYYNIKFEAIGNLLRARVWMEGHGEPEWWPLQVIDSRYPEGAPGIYAHGRVVVDYDMIAYGTEGAGLPEEWYCVPSVDVPPGYEMPVVGRSGVTFIKPEFGATTTKF